jgi:hypothetical protein
MLSLLVSASLLLSVIMSSLVLNVKLCLDSSNPVFSCRRSYEFKDVAGLCARCLLLSTTQDQVELEKLSVRTSLNLTELSFLLMTVYARLLLSVKDVVQLSCSWLQTQLTVVCARKKWVCTLSFFPSV